MSDDKKLKQARAAFKTLCDMLDSNDWHYDKDEDELVIRCSARGDDLSMDLKIEVDADRMLVVLLSPMPFTVNEERRVALAVATSVVNYKLADGSFDYDITSGRIIFRLTSCYRDSLVGKDMFEYMLYVSCQTIDEYNDKFLTIAKNDMSNDDIIKFLK